MKFRKKICIVVDGYSTGNSLANIFAAYGYSSLHIQSSEKIATNLVKSFRINDYVENIIYTGNLSALYDRIKSTDYEVICVIPGSEPGVELADILSERLNCPTSNGTLYSKARRNKFLMTEVVRKAGIPTVNYFKSNNVEDILRWINNYNQFSTPIVLKPLESSSTDGFHICYNEKDVREAFSKLYLSKNVFNAVNDEILVQNYLEGQEYCINTVSLNGKHYICEIWQINKLLVQHSKIYDRDTLLDNDAPECEILKQYTERVLNALHIHNGPAHTEIILTKNNGPILLETAARLMGSLDVSLITQSTNTNAVLLTAEAYLCPDVFLKRLNVARDKLKFYPCMVQLISTQEGILQGYCLDKLKQLKTFYGVDTYFEPGSVIKKTVDTVSSPGLVFLCSDNKSDLEHDYQLIRQMERSGEIYIILPILKTKDVKDNNYLIDDLPTIFNNKNEIHHKNSESRANSKDVITTSNVLYQA